MVPAYSQDMNQIPALRGKSKTWQTVTGHHLGPNDGMLLVRILNDTDHGTKTGISTAISNHNDAVSVLD